MLDKQVIRFESGKIPYKRKLDYLVCGGCKGIFPVSIVEDEDGIKGFYKTFGYKKISCLGEVGAAGILKLLEKTMDAVEEYGQYLIFPEEFVINTETAYVDSRFEKVRFTYMPSIRQDSLETKMLDYIEELKSITTENGRLYLNMAAELFSTEDISNKKIKAVLLKLRQEINLCNIM